MAPPQFIGIFNDVIGPVMRGPSSSHTAGSYHIASTARMLLGEPPVRAVLTFDRNGSYAETYHTQNADLAFAAGFLGWDLIDRRFDRALESARAEGRSFRFRKGILEKADHPNMVRLEIEGRTGRRLDLLAKSTGGGSFWIVEIEGRPVHVDGKTDVRLRVNGPDGTVLRLSSSPVFYPRKGEPLFLSATDAVRYARRKGISLGEAGRLYESALLGLSVLKADEEMERRLNIMKESIRAGFLTGSSGLKQLRPSARKILEEEKKNRLPAGGWPARAGARALAVMHAANSGAVICAAPTGGSSGVIPAVLSTLEQDFHVGRKALVRALFAAGAVGAVFARRATFAAEVAGCQVEIGAAGAMAAAAVVEARGGSAAEACHAAAVSLQNTMGSVCDLVAGRCEIPCHTRNAAAAASAFLCADLACGGYGNPIPLDETIDASLASGRMLPSELRVTSRGGLAVTPSARALGRKLQQDKEKSK
ncbi:MAG: L-serine ammonia-lyase, iron-sulfur-dependent, subunit alpha [Candidatus Aminicenantes bacterium]|nr:L-serine ammonia-lyase, iron-sulfur-dependent, subunit alpha [Candidatus Aminicenantes bacterium]